MSNQSPGRSVVPTISISEDGLGPAMLALNPAQRAFVYFKVFGLMNHKDAALAAGYSATGDSAKVMGYKLAHREDVQAAIREETRKLATTEGPPSIAKIIYLRDKAKDEKVQLRAAQDLLDRCGLGAISHSHVTVDHNVTVSDDELDRSLINMARELGWSERQARSMLLKPDRIIEGEWTEVPQTKFAEPVSAERRAALDRDNALRRERQSLTPEELAKRKNLDRSRRRDEAKAKYLATRNDIATAVARGTQIDVTAAVADAEAKFVAAYTEAQTDDTDADADADDGRFGLEDLIPSSSDASQPDELPAWRINK